MVKQPRHSINISLQLIFPSNINILILAFCLTTDDVSDFTYTLIEIEKEFEQEEEGCILRQFTPEHFLQMLLDFFSGEETSVLVQYS